MSRPRVSTLWLGAGIIAMMNLAILLAAWGLRQTVVTAWKKGPLIDPAAPYSPENAQLYFAIGACVALDVYFLALALWRRRGSAKPYVAWIAAGLALLSAEGVLRTALHFNPGSYFRPHPVLHWVVRSNLDHFQNTETVGTISTNEDGMREVKVPREKPPDTFRILVLGDSSNFGHGVEGDEMWESRLQDILGQHATTTHIEVLNGACPGWTTYQAVEMLRLYGLSYSPDLVIAGFNNDSGPEYLGDKKRALPPGPGRVVAGLLWRSELFLLGREAVLSTLRRLHPDSHYTERKAGESPHYGKLEEAESQALVPRVSKDEMMENLRTLQSMGQENGYTFAWINMPVNRREGEFVERYVDWSYRTATQELSTELGFPLIDVDGRWVRTRETGLHIATHVFHPSAKGHERMAEQIAAELVERGLVPGVTDAIEIGGPPAAPRPGTLRFGWSSLTPVHAHAGLVLQEHPEIAEKWGIDLVTTPYKSGKDQGEDLARGALDAWFTCEVPAVQMALGRPDSRIFASPGVLGRIAVVARSDRAKTLAELKDKKVGLSEGSTPAMDWKTWGQGLNATVVNLSTDALLPALQSGEVDAVVSWDPWVESWIQGAKPGELTIVAERPFRSELAVGVAWAIDSAAFTPPGHEDAPAFRLASMIDEALALAAADRPTWDAKVAELSGWPLPVVRAVADRNARLSGQSAEWTLGEQDMKDLRRAAAFAADGKLRVDMLIAPTLIRGEAPPMNDGPDGGPPGSPPKGGPPGQPPMGPPPGKGQPPMGPPPGKGPPKSPGAP